MKTRNLYVLMAAFVLLSCTKNDDVSPRVGETEFSVRSSVINVKVSTRTAYEGVLSPTNSLTALVLASRTISNYMAVNVVCNGTMTFTSNDNVVYNKPVTSGSYLFPTGESLFYLSALYPATGWDLATTDGKALRTLTGKEDAMFALQGMTNAVAVGDGNYPTLAFMHKLAFLRLLFSGDSQAVTAMTTITGIQLVNVSGEAIPIDMEVDLSSGSQVVKFSGAAATLDCYAKGTDTEFSTAYTITGEPVEIAYILAPPTPISAPGIAYEYAFRIDYKTGVESKSLVVSLDLSEISDELVGILTEGYAFNIKFRFVGGQIQAIATVADWKDGHDLDIDL